MNKNTIFVFKKIIIKSTHLCELGNTFFRCVLRYSLYSIYSWNKLKNNNYSMKIMCRLVDLGKKTLIHHRVQSAHIFVITSKIFNWFILSAVKIGKQNVFLVILKLYFLLFLWVGLVKNKSNQHWKNCCLGREPKIWVSSQFWIHFLCSILRRFTHRHWYVLRAGEVYLFKCI